MGTGDRDGAPALARPPGSDKDYWHRYTETYERAFAGLGPVADILEFGVLDGDSIRDLAARFPEARIVGADILAPRASWPVAGRIAYERIDQGDRGGVRAMFARLGRHYDLLIEDGSHRPAHQVTCLLEGLPYVRPGGLFVLEDLHSAHPDNAHFARHRVPGAPNALHVLLAFEHLKAVGGSLTDAVAERLASPAYFGRDDLLGLFAQIDGVTLYRRPNLPLRCYACGGSAFDYPALRCACGTDLYAATDSMTALIRKR